MRFITFVTVFLITIPRLVMSEELTDKSYIDLKGEISGVLTSDTPYRVVDDIIIPLDSSVTLEAGTTLLFTEFTGIRIQGVLYSKGSPEKPVVFTSIFDTCCSIDKATDPAPFDWSGIDIYENAGECNFTGCEVKYSVYGINSRTDQLTIVWSRFSQNGKSNLTIEGDRKDIEDNVFFSYYPPSKPNQTLSLTQPNNIKISEKPEISIDEQTDHDSSQKQTSGKVQVLRYSGLLIGIGCGTYTGVVLKTRYIPAKKTFDDLSELDEYKMQKKSANDWVVANERKKKYLKRSVAGASGALLGLLAFSFSFAF